MTDLFWKQSERNSVLERRKMNCKLRFLYSENIGVNLRASVVNKLKPQINTDELR